MNINGKMRIYSKDFNGFCVYSTNISNKKEDGTYENKYVTVQLPRDVKVNDKDIINVNKGFISFYKTKDGLPKIKLVVQELELGEQLEERESIQEENNIFSDGDLLPF